MPQETPGESPTRKPRIRFRLGRIGLGVLAVVVGLVVLGLAYEAVASANDRRNFPPPGERVDVGGRSLHLYCTGESPPGTPTIILETMAGGSLPNWAWVQPEIAKTARVCSYDRAGAGWSDPGPGAMGLRETAADLHTLLTRAGVDGPFVLVGHSKGGLIVRQFAADHPDEVVGIVLIDSAHPDQFDRHPEYMRETEDLMPLLRWTPLLARLGLMRLYAQDGFDFGDLPAQQKGELIAEWSAPKHWETEVPNLRDIRSFFEEAQGLGDLAALPLAVITAGDNDAAGWDDLQEELARLSTNAFHETIDGASHSSLAFNPEHAQATTEAILRLLEIAATSTSSR